MRGVGRQIVIEALDQENAVRKEAGLAPLTAGPSGRLRNEVKESIPFAVHLAGGA